MRQTFHFSCTQTRPNGFQRVLLRSFRKSAFETMTFGLKIALQTRQDTAFTAAFMLEKKLHGCDLKVIQA